jgi:hypothetical protein
MWAADRQGRRMRESYLKSVLRQEVGWHDVNHTGEVATRMQVRPVTPVRLRRCSSALSTADLRDVEK